MGKQKKNKGKPAKGGKKRRNDVLVKVDSVPSGLKPGNFNFKTVKLQNSPDPTITDGENFRNLTNEKIAALAWEQGGTTHVRVKIETDGDASMDVALLNAKRLGELLDRGNTPVIMEFDTGDSARDLELGNVVAGIQVQQFVPDSSDQLSDGPDESFEAVSSSDSESDVSDSEVGDSPQRFTRDKLYTQFLNTLFSSPPAARVDHFTPTQPKDFQKKFKPKKAGSPELQRSPASGSVRVEMESIKLSEEETLTRPTKVQGFVEITTTTGRPAAPEPISGVRVSQSPEANPEFNARNTGFPDVQKGHIMALELGGPDVPENIVPQWGQWQSNGRWRQMERQVLEFAKTENAKGNKVLYTAEVKYRENLDQSVATPTQLGFPIGFIVTLQVFDGTDTPQPGYLLAFNEEQEQDQTDDKLFGRQAEKLEGDGTPVEKTQKRSKLRVGSTD